MSTLWTPDGERPVRRSAPESPAAPTDPAAGAPGPGGPESPETAAELDELRRQLAETPVEIVVANHAYGLFELAALHLSQQPPQLGQARLAIDALAALVEGMAGRLGEPEPQLVEALAQLRMTFVHVHQAANAGGAPAPSPGE